MRKKIRGKTYEGKLIYNEDGQYEIHSPTGVVNISEILEIVYYASKNYIEFKVMCGCRVLYNEQGNLLMKPNKYGIYSYHISSECLEDKLFDNTNKNLEITIYADALKGVVAYARKQKRES